MSADDKPTLYVRLGGYNAISTVANRLVERLRADEVLGRFWRYRGEDGIRRELQLLVDFLCANAGGPLYYRGRDMLHTHRGMRVSSDDWSRFLGHLNATLDELRVPAPERADVLAFIESTRQDIVEA